MLRNILLFFTAVLLALTAGRAFWLWVGESPFEVSGPTYVEFFQMVDSRIAIPIAVTGIGGTLLAGLSAAVHYADRRVFYLLLAAFALACLGSVVTVVVNVPINRQIAGWNPTALPDDYLDVLRRWWEWHHVRLVATFAAMCLVIGALLARDNHN